MLYRKHLHDLRLWHLGPKRKPLVLRGARQVGKTTLIREMCRELDLHLIEINLESDTALRSTFTLFDPNEIMERVAALKRETFSSKSVLFIDEIQVVPEALQCLRYFFEKRPDVAVVAAGSLLEFAITAHHFSMPVGRVQYMFIGPLQFSEFLRALNELPLLEVYMNFELNDPDALSRWRDSTYHNRLMSFFFDFLHIGGMPEAVFDFCKNRDFEAAKRAQRAIVLNYRNDFPKYSKQRPSPIRLEKVFDYVPSHVGQKVKYSEIASDEQSRELKVAIDLLVKSNVIFKVTHTQASGLPLKMGEKESIFKLLFLDTGLVSYILKLDPVSLKNLYLQPNETINLLYRGLISEQFVGQHLLYTDYFEPPELHYWLRDGATNKAEVDYLLQIGTRIIPIEVKAGRTGSIKSLIQFIKEKDSKIAVKMGSKNPSIQNREFAQHKFSLVELPLYFSERLYELLTPLI